MGVSKVIIKALGMAIAVPFSFMVAQVGLYEGIRSYNLPIKSLYDGHPHYFVDYARRSIKYPSDLINFIVLAAIRFSAAYILVRARGKRGIGEALAVPFLTRAFLILYVVIRGESAIVISVPEDLIVPSVGFLGGLVSVAKRTLSKPKPLFQKLKEAGFKFEPHRLAHVEPPVKCPYCGATIHSNADVCRKCGRSLKEFYVEKIPEELRKYAFSRISLRV